MLLLKTNDGVGIDVSLGALDLEARMMLRSSVWKLDEHRSLRTCSAEDLIIQKTFAGRDQDWVDIRRIIERQGAGALDQDLIVTELKPLLELTQNQAAHDRLQQLLSNV